MPIWRFYFDYIIESFIIVVNFMKTIRQAIRQVQVCSLCYCESLILSVTIIKIHNNNLG